LRGKELGRTDESAGDSAHDRGAGVCYRQIVTVWKQEVERAAFLPQMGVGSLGGMRFLWAGPMTRRSSGILSRLWRINRSRALPPVTFSAALGALAYQPAFTLAPRIVWGSLHFSFIRTAIYGQRLG